jgi:hypothetical protein
MLYRMCASTYLDKQDLSVARYAEHAEIHDRYDLIHDPERCAKDPWKTEKQRRRVGNVAEVDKRGFKERRNRYSVWDGLAYPSMTRGQQHTSVADNICVPASPCQALGVIHHSRGASDISKHKHCSRATSGGTFPYSPSIECVCDDRGRNDSGGNDANGLQWGECTGNGAGAMTSVREPTPSKG